MTVPITLRKTPQPYASGLDYDKLYKAVSIAESGINGTPWHKKANNPVSIMTWAGGKRHLKQFKSLEENKAAFIALWKKSYGGRFPTYRDALKYTGGDSLTHWLNTVNQYYNSH